MLSVDEVLHKLVSIFSYNYLTGAASNDELILSHKIIKETSPGGRIQQESMDDILALAWVEKFMLYWPIFDQWSTDG